MRELRLDHVGIEAEALAQHRPRGGAEAVARHHVGRENHRAQRGVDGVVARGPVVMALQLLPQLALHAHRVAQRLAAVLQRTVRCLVHAARLDAADHLEQ